MSQLGSCGMSVTVLKWWHSRRWFEGSLLVSEKCTTPCNMEGQAMWEQYNKLKHYAWLPCRGYWLGRVHCSCQWMLIQSNDVLTFAWALATCVAIRQLWDVWYVPCSPQQIAVMQETDRLTENKQAYKANYALTSPIPNTTQPSM